MSNRQADMVGIRFEPTIEHATPPPGDDAHPWRHLSGCHHRARAGLAHVRGRVLRSDADLLARGGGRWSRQQPADLVPSAGRRAQAANGWPSPTVPHSPSRAATPFSSSRCCRWRWSASCRDRDPAARFRCRVRLHTAAARRAAPLRWAAVERCARGGAGGRSRAAARGRFRRPPPGSGCNGRRAPSRPSERAGYRCCGHSATTTCCCGSATAPPADQPDC